MPSHWTILRPSITITFSRNDDLTIVQSQAIKANGFVFLSAQLPADSQCKLLEGSVTDQTHKMIQNAGHVLEAAGSDLEKVVKVNVSHE